MLWPGWKKCRRGSIGFYLKPGGSEPAAFDQLRQQAEQTFAQRERAPLGREADAQGLLQELQVHQIELELQNEELRGTRVQLEQSLGRYPQLFYSAPLGYVTLRADGTIAELNHAAARMKLAGVR